MGFLWVLPVYFNFVSAFNYIVCFMVLLFMLFFTLFGCSLVLFILWLFVGVMLFCVVLLLLLL